MRDLRKRGFVKLLAIMIVVGMLCGMNGIAVAFAAEQSGKNIPSQIVLSWTSDPQTTQTISWFAGQNEKLDKVQYLPAADFTGSFSGAQTLTAVSNRTYNFFSEGDYRFEVTLQDLTPGTEYVYRVGLEGSWSDSYSFITAAAVDEFSFMYMGDVQKGYEDWGTTLKGAVADNIGLKFLVMGGDLVDDSDNDNWQQFLTAGDPVFAQLPLMPAAGNHDTGAFFRSIFALPENGPEYYPERFYSFDYGNSHITVLDSNYLDAPGLGGNYEAISTWLKADLKNSAQQWKFVVLHHPPYPVVYDKKTDNLQENWVPIFEEGGVDIVLTGHQHVYMRTKPMKEGQVQADGGGITYVMGNSSSKFYAAGPGQDYIAKEIANVSNYQVIKIDGAALTLISKDTAGEEIDRFTLTKQDADKRPMYTLTPKSSDVYEVDAVQDGFMTVKSGIEGWQDFYVQVVSLNAHDGMEGVAFTQQRDGVQKSWHIDRRDFDETNTAQARFDVRGGDVIRIYMVDNLTGDVNFNPTMLQ